MFRAGLVLEGGGMRGVYTAGVLDSLMDKQVCFESVYGVSAGAIQAVSFLSGQRGRGYETTVGYLKDSRYCSVRSLLTTGNLFGVDFCYHQIPNRLHPFDYDAFARNPTKLYAVMTDVASGRAVYRRIADMREDTVAVRASGSLPFVSRMVRVDGRYVLDGGISDSIPIDHALAQGYERLVVVLTRHADYEKKPSRMSAAGWLRYPLRPKLRRALAQRNARYNEQARRVRELEREGKALVIRPKEPVVFSRMEKDAAKLEALYLQGLRDGAEAYDGLRRFLEHFCN